MTILFSLLLLLAPAVSAQEETPISLRDFSGGLVDNRASVALQPNESPDTLNVMVDDPWGSVKTRPGYSTCGNTPSGRTATALYEYIKSDGNHNLIVTDNINVWTTLDCVTFTTITTSGVETQPVYFDTFRDKLWIVNGSTWTRHWNGTTLTTSTEAPRGQYITHWKERVWMARVPSGLSTVQFSSLVDDAGVTVDPSVSTQVWSAANAYYIGQDDGSPIYAIKVYKDNLYVFKERSIYRIIFESELNTALVKTVAEVGCKFQDSIVELDNFIYFVGPDGIYKFDGNDAVRISDNINGLFKRLKQPARVDKYKLWDTALDFGAGTFDGVSSTTVSGSLVLYRSYTDAFTDGNYTTNPTWTVASGVFSATTQKLVNTNDGLGTQRIHTPSIISTGTWSWDTYVSPTYRTYVAFMSTYNTDLRLSMVVATGGSLASSLFLIQSNGVPALLCATNALNASSSTHVSVSRDSSGNFSLSTENGGCSVPNTVVTDSNYFQIYYDPEVVGYEQYVDNIIIGVEGYIGTGNSTGTWVSEISTFTDLTLYRTFDADQIAGGQNVDYFVRTATTAYNVGLQPWSSITPGAVVSTTAVSKYYQVRALLTTTDIAATPQIDSIIQNYQTGDSTLSRLSAIKYDNRYMVSASSTPSIDYNDVAIVKTKQPLDNFVPWDYPVSYFTEWNNNLYGGIASGSGIARFMFGTNDNGTAIKSHWAWGDQHWGRLSYKKKLNELYLFYVPTNDSSESNLSYSLDGGTTWTDNSVDMSGSSGYASNQLLLNGGISNTFRFKISNNALDETFNVLGLDAWGKSERFRE